MPYLSVTRHNRCTLSAWDNNLDFARYCFEREENFARRYNGNDQIDSNHLTYSLLPMVNSVRL
jgi:hypothetical protein